MTAEVANVWAKILTEAGSEAHTVGRVGCIPVYDTSEQTWQVFRNNITIHPHVENTADPAKVDRLRMNVRNLLDHYPETIEQLEKRGARVRALLNRRIETREDVVAWANSLFNVGPSSKYPNHVHETMDVAYDDSVIEVKGGRKPVYVIPAVPRDSDSRDLAVLDFSMPGSKVRYGPRHEYTKLAFSKKPKYRYRGKTAEGEPLRKRGRPRKDGLAIGSPEAFAADEAKRQKREAWKAAREAKRNGHQPAKAATNGGPPSRKRRLARLGDQTKKA